MTRNELLYGEYLSLIRKKLASGASLDSLEEEFGEYLMRIFLSVEESVSVIPGTQFTSRNKQ